MSAMISRDALIALGITVALIAASLQKIVPPAPATVVGIDLGTTFSCVAVFDKGAVRVIGVEPNSTVLPSVVSLREDGRHVVGSAAWNQEDGGSIVYDAKRFIGRPYEPGMQEAMDVETRQLPFKVVRGWSDARNQHEPHILPPRWSGKPVRPEEVSAMLLRRMRDAASAAIGRSVKAAVLAVPVDFTALQRNATREAAALAGLSVLRLLHEPTAAAIAYGLHEAPEVRSVIVYDLGGGTLDVSFLTLENGIFSVRAASGNNFLGGQDVNTLLLDHVQAAEPSILDACADPDRGRIALRDGVERLKLAMGAACDCRGRCAGSDEERVSVTASVCGQQRVLSMSRVEFAQVARGFAADAMEPLRRVLEGMEITTEDVDELVLVGGSTRLPFIRSMLTEKFGGRTPNCMLPPEEAVARGTAIQAGILTDAKNIPIGAMEATSVSRM